jgi:predicted Fe-Mo cluster-binding NifX family protein
LSHYRIAVATNGNEGLEDVVSKVFGRTRTFTILDVVDEKIEEVTVLENPGASYKYGAGPIVVKMLVDKSVDVVLAYVLGFGAAGLLKQHSIKHIPIKPNMKVGEATKEAIQRIKEERTNEVRREYQKTNQTI